MPPIGETGAALSLLHGEAMTVLLAVALVLIPLILTGKVAPLLARSESIVPRIVAGACGLGAALVILLGLAWPSLYTFFGLAAIPGALASIVCVVIPQIARRSRVLRFYLAWCGLSGVTAILCQAAWLYYVGAVFSW
jgi:hypothetical protein